MRRGIGLAMVCTFLIGGTVVAGEGGPGRLRLVREMQEMMRRAMRGEGGDTPLQQELATLDRLGDHYRRRRMEFEESLIENETVVAELNAAEDATRAFAEALRAHKDYQVLVAEEKHLNDELEALMRGGLGEREDRREAWGGMREMHQRLRELRFMRGELAMNDPQLKTLREARQAAWLKLRETSEKLLAENEDYQALLKKEAELDVWRGMLRDEMEMERQKREEERRREREAARKEEAQPRKEEPKAEEKDAPVVEEEAVF